MATHSSTLAWKIPWTEEPGRLQSMESLRVGHDWANSLSLSRIGEGNGNPLQCSCLENPRDGGAWWLPSMGSHRVGHGLAAAAAGSSLTFQWLGLGAFTAMALGFNPQLRNKDPTSHRTWAKQVLRMSTTDEHTERWCSINSFTTLQSSEERTGQHMPHPDQLLNEWSTVSSARWLRTITPNISSPSLRGAASNYKKQ